MSESQRRLAGCHFLVLNLVMGLAHMVVLFNAGSYVALLPHASGNLGGVLPSFGTWAQTDFLIALALAFPIARWLSSRFGETRVFGVSFVAYALASSLCLLGSDITTFLPARVLLGITGGLTLPLGQSLLLKEYPDRLKSLGLAIWGLFTLMPFTAGLAIGGWVADELGWRGLFAMNIPLALLIAGTSAILLPRHSVVSQQERFDVVGYALLAVIFVGIQTIFNLGNDFDWLDSPLIQVTLLIVAAAIPIWIIWELGEERPAVNVRLFLHRNFTVGLVALGLGFLSIQGLLSLFVVQLQTLLGYSSTLAGFAFLPMLLFGVPLIAIMHEVAKRVDVRLLASLNAVGLAATFYWIGLFDDPQSYDQIFWPMVVEGLFLASFFTPLTVLTLHGLSSEQMMSAAEVANLFRIAAGAIGITWQSVVVFRRIPFHQLSLSDHFGGRMSPSYDAWNHIVEKLQAVGFDPAVVERHLQLLMKQEAGILALNDAFLLSSYLCLGLAVLVWFARSSRIPALNQPSAVRAWKAEELMEQP